MRNVKVATLKAFADKTLRTFLAAQLLISFSLPAMAEEAALSARPASESQAAPASSSAPSTSVLDVPITLDSILGAKAATAPKAEQVQQKVEAKAESSAAAKETATEVKTTEVQKTEETKETEAKTEAKTEAQIEETQKVSETPKSDDSDSALTIDNDKPARKLSSSQSTYEVDTVTTESDKATDAKAAEGTAPVATATTDATDATAEVPTVDEKGVSIAATAVETKLESPDSITGLPKGSILSQEAADLSGHILDVDRADLVADAAITVDNDEEIEAKATIEYKELPTDDGKTRIISGARFPVVISSQINSKTAKKGDPIEARLKYDLKIGDRLVAKKGSKVSGHIDYCLPARSVLHSLVSPTRWYRNSGCLGLTFDEIVTESGEHLPLSAAPARQGRIIKNKGEGRELGVNHHGQITGPWGQQLRYKAVRIGLNFALAPAGVFSFGAMPVALGVIGAINPSFAFMKPVGLNVRHRRIKGFAWGFLSGIPGSWLIEDTVTKGQEAIVKPGDEFLAEFKQEFTGEPASEATLLPGSKAKVKGEVMTELKKKDKK